MLCASFPVDCHAVCWCPGCLSCCVLMSRLLVMLCAGFPVVCDAVVQCGVLVTCHAVCRCLLQVEAAIVRRKKMELLKRYTSSSLMEQEETVKQMLGV